MEVSHDQFPSKPPPFFEQSYTQGLGGFPFSPKSRASSSSSHPCCTPGLAPPPGSALVSLWLSSLQPLPASRPPLFPPQAPCPAGPHCSHPNAAFSSERSGIVRVAIKHAEMKGQGLTPQQNVRKAYKYIRFNGAHTITMSCGGSAGVGDSES